MKLNEVIRKYRKGLNLTQEQVANYLGVSAPAVNKWETGNSYPDITLLAPLARVLKINLDTLLSFEEDLTDQEINHFLEEVTALMHQEGYESGFKRCQELILEYPNCDKMTLTLAQVANAYLSILNVTEKEGYEKKITAWYELAMNSSDPSVANMATANLSQIYLNNKDYEKAQALLDQIPPLGFDKRNIQAKIYFNTNREDDAYRIYEEQLLQSVNNAYTSLSLITDKLCQQKKFDEASPYITLTKQLAELFDLGPYMTCTPSLLFAVEQQDKEETLHQLALAVDTFNQMTSFTKSPLFSHMKFKENNDLTSVKLMFVNSLKSDPQMEFIRDDPRFERLMKRLEGK